MACIPCGPAVGGLLSNIADYCAPGDIVPTHAREKSTRRGRPEIVWDDRDPTGEGPRLVGRVNDRGLRAVRYLVVPKGITHTFLEEGSTIHLEGVRDSWNRRQGVPELVLTERTEIAVIEEPVTGKQRRGSLEGIAKEVADRTDPNREVGRPESVMSDAKRRARSQQRDPAIDPRLR